MKTQRQKADEILADQAWRELEIKLNAHHWRIRAQPHIELGPWDFECLAWDLAGEILQAEADQLLFGDSGFGIN